ncbi:hypothetical protein BH18GEM1_BH18GEM1_19850 [soil metagenome]
MRYMLALTLGAVLALGSATSLFAQHNHWEFNAHAGAFRYDLGFGDDRDNEDTDVLVGARLARHWESGWGFGLNGDWIFADQIDLPATEENEDINIDLYLYYADLYYTFPSAGRANFFLSAGIGGAATRVTDIPGPDDDRNTTDLLIPLGLGLKFHNNAEDPTWALRFDVKDHLIWRDDIDLVDPVEIEDGTELKNNFEFSGGISFFFGGGPSEPPPPEDTDGDGVYDDRDQCPNTPLGTQVDSFGCPVPLDSDGDGVTDDRDQCPNTLAGAQVDANGCEIVEEAAAACADGRDWYRFNETISVDGRNWVKFGSSTTIPMEDLVQVGDFDGVPVYVRANAREPYTEAFVPLCAPADTYQPYQVEREVRGTTG